jgi:hypothetical protein
MVIGSASAVAVPTYQVRCLRSTCVRQCSFDHTVCSPSVCSCPEASSQIINVRALRSEADATAKYNWQELVRASHGVNLKATTSNVKLLTRTCVCRGLMWWQSPFPLRSHRGAWRHRSRGLQFTTSLQTALQPALLTRSQRSAQSVLQALRCSQNHQPTASACHPSARHRLHATFGQVQSQPFVVVQA